MTTTKKISSNRLSRALQYARYGLHVLPVYGITKDGHCACDAGEKCDRPAKHPKAESGVRDATTDAAQITAWWTKWPNANIGIVPGRRSGIVAIYVRRSDTDALSDLEAKFGKLDTVTILTPDGDRILLFRYPPFPVETDTSGDMFGWETGLQIWSDDFGYIVAPPSCSVSGEKYKFGPCKKLRELPDHWLDYVKTALERRPGLVIQRAADVEARPVGKIWAGRFFQCKIGLIAGEAGLGKSLIGIHMAATVSTGGEWPCGEGRAKAGCVVFITAEDNAADTVRPRLEVAGANLKRIHIIDAHRDGYTGLRPFNLMADLESLDEVITKIQNVRLVLIDPLNACMGPIEGQSFNPNSVTDVRALLGRLESVVAKHQAAVVGITHFAKKAGGSLLAQITGSFAFTAAARSVLTVTRDSEDPNRRILAFAKNNLGNDTRALAFRVHAKRTATGLVSSCISWERAPVSLAPGGGTSKQSPTTTEAVRFLCQTVTRPIPAKKILLLGSGAGFTPKELRTAAKILAIKSKRVGGLGADGRWAWFPSAKSK
jgi:putative DNA primase/helicase